jgi:hypothetical protein
MLRTKVLIMLSCLVISSHSQEIVRGTYSYTYGDSETLVQARQTCKNLAVRDAIESYYLFVESTTTVENSQTKNDLISAIAAGIITDLKTVDQKEEGRVISTTVEGKVNPDQVRQLVAQKTEAKRDTARAGAADTLEAPKPSAVDEETQFRVLLSKFENKMAPVQGDWNAKKFDSAAAKLQEIQAWLDRNGMKSQHPFYGILLPSMKTRNAILIDLIQKEKAEHQGKKIRAKGALRPLLTKTEQLEKDVRAMENLQNLPPKQAMIRSWWTGVCRQTVNRVRYEIRGRS